MGEGTTVTIIVAGIQPADVAATLKSTLIEAYSFGISGLTHMRKRILLVDDEEDIVNLVRMILEDAGYHVSSVTDGREALKKVQSESFDLILLDIMMPILSGWEILNQLRQDAKTKEMPVALLTARASPQDDNQPHPTDYCDYITKPFEPEDLLRRVKHILSS